MFKSFYKDIDTLHELVKPFMYEYTLKQWRESWDEFRVNIGELLADAFRKNDQDA